MLQSKVNNIAALGKKIVVDTQTGTVLASFVLAGVFGSLACTFLGDIWGRRWTIFAAVTTELVGVILMGSSFQFAQFIIARIILGLGTGTHSGSYHDVSWKLTWCVGGIISTTSVWQAELSKPHSRGSHVSGFGIFCGMGLVLALWVRGSLSVGPREALLTIPDNF